MFEKLKKWLAPELYHTGYQPVKSEEGESTPPDQNTGAQSSTEKKKKRSPKELATEAGEPYINVISVDLDPNDINNGAFNLDWNDKFVADLMRRGYHKKETDTDSEIVDRWFTQVCRNIALEVYEQSQADPENREHDLRVIQRRDIGNGYTEIS